MGNGESVVMREGRGIQRRSIWCTGLSGLSRSSNQINQKNQTDEMNQRDQMNQLLAARREMVSGASISSESSQRRRSQRASQTAGVVRHDGREHDRRGLQQRGVGGGAWRIFYRNCRDSAKKRLPTPFHSHFSWERGPGHVHSRRLAHNRSLSDTEDPHAPCDDHLPRSA